MVNRKQLDPSSSHWAPFGVQLRRSREAAGLTQAELARKVGYDPSYVSYTELASREAPSEQFARKVDEVLNTGGTLVLMWFQHKHTALLEGFPEYAAQEAKAAKIRVFELGLVPGLFQTPDYAAAIAAAAVQRGSITSAQAAQRAAFLSARQQLFERTKPPLVHAVLDESCLRRQVGGPEVMVEQFRHLEALAERPNVILQVAPFGLGERAPFMMAVYLLTLPTGTMLGYTESHQRGLLERERDTVIAWDRDYDRLQVEALSRADSLAMIRAVREEPSPCPALT
ncbi:helix-turn-helix domain-containing protein [Kitasatospora sp. NPDC087315]|uniref:helix-turn-helix domain-containing protein n=1 Tax=Kitasatospora sp. NPDC087315 TaxID=3364069 RepID=UPI0037FDF5BC